MSNIFIVEDDESIRELVIYALEANKFQVTGFESGRYFFDALQETEIMPSLVLLDIMLPEMDGFGILNKLRETDRYSAVPVIMLTAKGSEMDKVKALNGGADDYVTKPFGVMELVSRINAVLRRNSAVKPRAGIPAYKNISIDKDRRSVFVDGNKITLTYKEYELLNYFILNAELVISRDTIIETIWGYDFDGESRTVDMHVKTLRQKLGEAAGGHIKTVRNVGYKIGE